jgi:3-oxoadipate enol-lactonase
VRGLVLASFPAGPASGRGIAGEAPRFADAIEREGLEAAGARFVWGPHAGLDRSSAALVRRGFLEHPPAGLVHTLRELLAVLPSLEDLAPQLRRLVVPALVVAGAADAASLPVCHELAELIPRGRLVEIPEAGHVVNLERPEAFQAAVRGFLDEITLE